ncbi:MAG: sigma-54 dependent transcriptional regulator [Thermoanaerobaculia bacterium]
MNNILVVDDEPNLRQLLKLYFEQKGWEVTLAASGTEALNLFEDGSAFQLVILDIKMPDISGLEVLIEMKKRSPIIPVIMITAFGSHTGALEALRQGAYDYITKPFELEELYFRAQKALEKVALEKEIYELREETQEKIKYGFILGKSPAMLKIAGMIEKVSKVPTTVLITGESGTGKELIAKAIHNLGPRKNYRFVSINCGAIPETLLESELFGYEKGAFTGALKSTPGLFQVADKGTIFLDEIGEMSLPMQVKLLRVLQDRMIRPVGSTKDIEVDVRVIAATNQNLENLVQEKRFREDLYYRINVIHINIPPLRQRKEDVPVLVQAFIKKFCEKMGILEKKISLDAMRILENYPWPGNIRELENVIERAVTLEPTNVIRLSSLPHHIVTTPIKEAPIIDLPEEGIDLQRHLDEITKRLILQALERTNWNQTKAAKLLKLSFRSMRYYVQKFNLKSLHNIDD